MSLWILNNANSEAVANDLRTICKDPTLTIDTGTSPNSQTRGTGAVSFSQGPTLSSLGSQVLSQLIASPTYIAIRGETDGWAFSPQPLPNSGGLASVLGNTAGATPSDTFPNPNPTLIEVAYTVQNNSGYGFWVQDANGNHIRYPSDVMLFHELAHALNFIIATVPINADLSEQYAIQKENQYRASLGMKQRVGHQGGPNPQPHQSPSSNCFIATAAFDSPLAPEVQVLRSVRDGVLRQTSAGERFFNRYWDVYYRLSPLIVRAMNDDPEIKELVKWSIVTPLVHYYELLLDFPDQAFETVSEPWRSFLSKLKSELETWASVIELPCSLANKEPALNARELAVTLRYILRSEDKRAAYLSELELSGQIPLMAEPEQLREAERELRRYQRPNEEIERILGVKANASNRQVLLGVSYTEVYSLLNSAVAEQLYSVRINNLSGVAFQQIALFYDQTDAPGAVIGLFENDVQPGQVTTFILGSCGLVNRYNIGVFDYQNKMVGSVPDPNDAFWQGLTTMTPDSSRQFQAQIGNTAPCLDVWVIEPQDLVRP